MIRSFPVRTAVATSALVALTLLGGCGSSSSTSTTSAATSTAVSMPSGTGAATGGASASIPAPAGSSARSGSDAKATPLPVPPGALKKAATAKLPARLGGYSGQVVGAGANTANGMYTGATPDQMLMVALVKGGDVKVFTSRLAGARVDGHAVCGKQQGVATCVIPLQGGYISAVGTDRDAVGFVGALANRLWAALS